MAQHKHVQEIEGTLLYYSWALDPTLACALSSIDAKQTDDTTSVLDSCHQLLNYVATHPHVAIHYHASEMILAIHSDASYLSEPNSSKPCWGTLPTEHNSNVPNLALFSYWLQSLNMLYPLHLKQNLQLSFTIVKMQCLCRKHLRKWSISLKLLSQLITPQRMDSLLTPWFPKHQKPWT